jgi:chemotaxis family two-component system response regulator Rcp1
MEIENGSINILLVEDNPGDIRLTQEAFKESDMDAKLYVTHDGEEAISFLMKKSGYRTMPKPNLILLDLNLPKKDGREVLKEIKTNPAFMQIPVVILTTSKADEDISNAYNLYANCYIAKPIGLEDFIDVIQCIGNFWLKVVQLPVN